VVRSPASLIFHLPKFVFRNPDKPIIFFEDRAAQIYFSRIGNELISIDNAPFGSFMINDELTKDDLSSCLKKITLWSQANGITSVVIRSFPEIYNSKNSALTKQALLASGFDILCEDVAQIVNITESGLNVNTHKKRRLRKAQTMDFSFRELQPDLLKDGYALIVETRQKKGYPVTMSLEGLQRMFDLFPDDYLLFGVLDKNQLIAASVCIKINPEILYCFYIGDDLEYRPYSPVTSLVNGIYDFCKDHHFKILDLGISTEKGKLNKGLYTFKKSFGSVDSYKLTFLKQL